ncbi:BTB/POZ domain-containing protein [Dichanthelium oligosanthes]|uniref:BTB/POZ domain-containing protein n=1 Tax=Dichanthelium oligosanthes TaxID=888268 RepID=A0A1E5W7V8_9POAL|nr:BTB/POZ domain-containing protein [Dichanthelium oligosanthes]
MADSTHHTIRRAAARPRGWCCSFAGVPESPDYRALPSAAGGGGGGAQKLPPKSPLAPSFHSSPSSKLAGLIDPRRILSPGRVSPIDSEGSPVVAAAEEDQGAAAMVPFVAVREDEEEGGGGLDLRLSLRGRDGRRVVMELDSAVLCDSSAFFADMVPDASGGTSGGKRIEVDGVDNLDAFKEAVELMFEPDAMRWLARAGLSRAIAVLEVSSSIMFDRGIESCLKYIEAVPWNENEEEKLKRVFSRCTFDESVCKDVLARLQQQCRRGSEDLTVQLVEYVTSGTNSSARKEMQSLVSGLLSKSSVYHKDLSGLNKGGLYQICYSCLSSLVELFVEDSGSVEDAGQAMTVSDRKPMIERISKQTENLNWLFDILVNNDMAEEFVELWAKQDELVRMHEQASPMFRYELSRISASVFIALGKGRIQCPSDTRSQLFYGWFMPMLMDFGWLQRCSKGLDVRILEENLGQALLTLPLQQQQSLFEEWFRCFASRGTECPNLSGAFQVWWRRSFVRSSLEVRR